MTIRVCVAGATGWVGRSLVPAIEAAADFRLVGAVARRAAGETLAGVTVRASLDEALAAETDVVIDYTKPDAGKANALAAFARADAFKVVTTALGAAD
jgi:4-hydroxy-tetrahydrodipicolinate reductase